MFETFYQTMVVLLWLLGGIGLLIVDASHRARHSFSIKVFILAIWPFLVILTVVMWFFQTITSKRVR